LRRSEAVLLFLFIATAVVFFATRPRTDSGQSSGLLGAPALGAKPTAAATQPIVSTDSIIKPTPTAAAAPPYFSNGWLQAHPAADAPAVTAQGLIVLDRDTQQIMLAKDEDSRRPPASIMKIVTAMVALDTARPSQTIEVSRDAANMEPNRMGLSYGEHLTVQELLYGLLLDSGNDAAEALADSLPGGRAAFIQKMNEKVAGLGLKNTHFVEPAGLDDDNYTTPYDMAALADVALTGYPTIRTVVSTKEVNLPATSSHKPFHPINLNDLLWDYPGTYGMKVGYTDAADYTIILAGQKDNHNMLMVLLGSDHHFTEGHKLFDWAYAHLPTPDGSPVRALAANLEKS